MRAGRLSQQVTVQRLTETPDAFGQVQNAWADVATVWAGVQPLVGREQLERMTEVATFDTRVRMRYGAVDVTQADRLVWGERVFDVVSVVEPYANKRELVLLCREILN